MSGQGSLFDANVWVALAFELHPFHASAVKAFLARSATDPACFCRATQLSFLRLISTETVALEYGLTTPSNREALELLNRLLATPAVRLLEEPPKIFSRWSSLADLRTASPKRWMDAYLAAFAIEAGVDFVTYDKVFLSFSGLAPKLLTPVRTQA